MQNGAHWQMAHADAHLVARPADDRVLHVEVLRELPGLVARHLATLPGSSLDRGFDVLENPS